MFATQVLAPLQLQPSHLSVHDITLLMDSAAEATFKMFTCTVVSTFQQSHSAGGARLQWINAAERHC
jgi:hypothetical protein